MQIQVVGGRGKGVSNYRDGIICPVGVVWCVICGGLMRVRGDLCESSSGTRVGGKSMKVIVEQTTNLRIFKSFEERSFPVYLYLSVSVHPLWTGGC